MPIYVYSCKSCNHAQEHLHKMNEVVDSCPKCASRQYEKQLTAPGMLSFKGNGFYETDFKTPCGATKTEVEKMGCGGNCACHPS